MKKLMMLVLVVMTLGLTSVMAKTVVKDASADRQDQKSADDFKHHARHSQSKAEVINIKVSSIRITILRNRTDSKQNPIVSASIGRGMPGEALFAD